MKVQKLNYPQFNETLYRTTLFNGLTVNLLPREGFYKTYAVMTTNYGSVDTQFVNSQGKQVDVLAGTAHFLEHKLFEKKTMMLLMCLASMVLMLMPLRVLRRPVSFFQLRKICPSV